MSGQRVHVAFHNVSKRFDNNICVVDNLSLNIYDSEFLTVLGPSGSGKTTCLMMLAGFEDVSAGSITIYGQRVNDIPPYKRNIGFVFQDYALFPHMTVADNLAFPLQVRKTERAMIRKRVAETLDMVKLGDLAKRFPAQLSGGQQQRVALARALIFHPDLVLMDEPLGALDKQLRDQMQYEIKHLHEEFNFTVLYVTHDQNEALILSDRIAVFNEGKIQQVDEPDMLYESPANTFSAGFIGENNILSGKLLRVCDDTCTVEFGGYNYLQGTPVNLRQGTPFVSVAIRPERILINPDTVCDNIFSAEVRRLIYFGDYIRTVVALSQEEELAIKFPNRRGKRGLSVGQQVKVGWHPEDCRVFSI